MTVADSQTGRPRFRRTLVAAVLTAVTLQSGSSYAAMSWLDAVSGVRVLTPDDLFELEALSDVAIAPDGRAIAFVRHRRLSGGSSFQREFNASNRERGDVWVVEGDAVPVNITNGARDGSGYWLPRWSPDGERLAMLSTKGGDNVRLVIWERKQSRIVLLSARGVAMDSGPSFLWLNSGQLALVALPEGQVPPEALSAAKAALAAAREWPRVLTGHDVTASVLESGTRQDPSQRPRCDVLFIGIDGLNRVVSSSPSILDLRLSPDGRHLAFLKAARVQAPEPDVPLQHLYWRWGENRYSAQIVDTSGTTIDTKGLATVDVIPRSFQWSPDGHSFAFVGTSRDDGPAMVFRGAVSGTTEQVNLPGDAGVQTLKWADEQRLLISAEVRPRRDPNTGRRVDWWVDEPGKAVRSLTARAQSVPRSFTVMADGHAIVGVANGRVWNLDITSGALTCLTKGLGAEVTTIVWPSADDPGGRAPSADHLIVSAQTDAGSDIFQLSLRSRSLKRLQKPSPLASIAAHQAENDLTLFIADEPTGTRLTVMHGMQQSTLVETNGFLREIEPGTFRQIEYDSLDGNRLNAWLILPPMYQPGRRYPVVAWLNPGWIAGASPPKLTQLNLTHALNLQLLAAPGNVVLLPSMPTSVVGQVNEYMSSLMTGLLPAVAKVCELGIGDPARLAVMGHSIGAYGTLGVITQTTRFRTAIALESVSDLASFYGTLDPNDRYTTYPHENHFNQSIAETGILHMGSSPWRDPAAYSRNSPLSYVSRVRTPVLIVHGDTDYVSLTQSEQFFTALHRQNKRARFVRYWGEGHVFASAANIRDLWSRIYEWLNSSFVEPAAAEMSAETPTAK